MTTALDTIRSPALPDRSQAFALARFLGWFSIALGVTELVLPHTLSRALGLGRRPGLLAAYGVREIAAGAGILLGANPAPWVQARIAGDALDLATLAAPLVASRGHRGASALAALAVAGVTALDILCARQLSAPPR